MHRTLARTCAATLALALLFAASVAAATDEWRTPRFEIGGFGGVMDYDAARQMNGQVYGARFGINMSPQLGIEAVLGSSPVSGTSGTGVTRIWISHADLVLHLMPGAFSPYVSGGFGNLSRTTTGSEVRTGDLHMDAGGGVKWWLSDRFGLRGDMHGYWSKSEDTNGTDRRYADVMASVGVVVGLGSTRHLPADTDSDGVADIDDRCSGTPLGVAVDLFGCPADTDRDGVADYLDRCASTPLHAWVDDSGCQTDDDTDGVADGLDRCLDTPQGAVVDARGCPVDSDGDGVYDGLDLCAATVAGVEVDDSGCPIAKPIARRLVLHSINFATGSADILPISFAALDDVAASLHAYPEATFEIRGYADATGPDAVNLRLTRERATAVRNYLVTEGIDPSRLRARGYGELDPIAPNATPEGRAMNRRVEFHRIDD